MKRIDLRIAFCIVALAAWSGSAWCQSPPAGALQVIAGNALSDVLAGRPTASQFRLLPEPRFVVPQADGAYSFAEFDRIPAGPGVAAVDTLGLTSDELLTQLRRLEETIELSEPELTRDQEASLASARALLYENARTQEPTQAHRTYLEFDKRYNGLRAQLTNATNAAERASLQLEMRTTEQDWNTYGRRLQIAQALDAVARFTPEQTGRLREAWRAALTASSGADYARVFPAIAGSSGWTALTVPVPADQSAGRMTLTKRNGSGPPVSQDLAGVAQLSMRVLVWRIPRPVLEHPFLRSPNWRSKQSFVLSDGLPISAPSELVPRVISALVLGKGLELTFSSDTSWQTVSQALATSDTVSLGGLTLKTPSAGSPFASPGYVGASAPFVLGVVVSEIPKIPNPSPNDDWPLIRW
jgi:hypothetical protein